MASVALLDGLFYESQQVGKNVLLELDVDRLLAPCYEAAGLKAKKPRYGGWEATEIAGHSVGHYLSASAAMFAATGDEALQLKLNYALDELVYLQGQDDEGYVGGVPRSGFEQVFTGDFEVHNFNLAGVWVPWYNLHKLYAGLIDAYRWTGSEKALQVVTKLADWAKRGTDRMTDEQFQRMLICEHGGMNEAMADLYMLTGNPEYLELAVRFCHQAILEPLSRGVDELEGKHANTQIPKVIGAAKLYEITGEEKYRRIAEFFWREVIRNRSYIIGGNSIFEHFRESGDETLGVESAETCNTYNMLRLTGHLFRWSPDAEYMDFYERALYNHILASQDPDSGMKMYFISTEPGHFKVYGTPDHSFWCCTGTGMENPARYSHDIYHEVEDGVYVNLFIASQARLHRLQTVIRQETEFPMTDRTRIVVEQAGASRFTMYIRVPYWAAGPVTAVVNGEKTYTRETRGYLSIERDWQDGDTIEVTLPMNLHVYRAKDDEQKVGFLYGPIVLAGALGREQFPESDIIGNHLKLHHHPLIDVPVLVSDEQDVQKLIQPVESRPLMFRTAPIGEPGGQQVELIPFYALHHQRYTIYWKLMSKSQYASYQDTERAQRERLHAITIDVVSPFEQQSEVEHQIKSEGSRSGYQAQAKKGYRDAVGEGYFSYRMAVLPDKPVSLRVTYFGNEWAPWIDGVLHKREFEILIDGTRIARENLDDKKRDEVFDVDYVIPEELTRNKHHVEVKFVAEAGSVAGGVFGIRMVDMTR